MTKDKALEELFLAKKPHFDDHDIFMASLAKRLDAVEFIHQHQEATIRRYKMAMIATFVVGIISGAITMAFILSMPADVPLFTFQVQTRYLLWQCARHHADAEEDYRQHLAIINFLAKCFDYC